MGALTADRNTPRREAEQFEYPAAASKEFFVGALVVLDTAGNAEPATTATGKIAAGVCQEYLLSTTAAAEKVKLRAGCYRFVNAETITKAHIGDMAYALDDQSVYRTGTGKSPVGPIVDVDSVGVWVNVGLPLAAPTVGLLAANNLSDVGTVATARSSLGLDTADAPTFADITITDDALISGIATGLQKTQVVAANAYTVVSAADGDIVIFAAADNDVVTLPDAAAANLGMRVTVINNGADAACKVSISPHSSDKIFGGIHGAAGGDLVSFAEGADKDIINTKATTKKGDYAVLVSDGALGWNVIGGKGVWASQP